MDRTGLSGAEGTVELSRYLDEASDTNALAAEAPRSGALYAYLLAGSNQDSTRPEFELLIEALIRQTGIWWHPSVTQKMPVLTPWCVRDRSCRYDQGPEAWGSPMPTGHLRDDNSIIKKLPLPLVISAPSGHRYGGRKPWRGFTACHIWRNLIGEDVAGRDAWLYSFVPNLVWLPRWIAPLSDRQGSFTQDLLKRMSYELHGSATGPGGVGQVVSRSWTRLGGLPDIGSMTVDDLATFTPTEAFFHRRLKTIDAVVAGCRDALEGRSLSKRLVCSRYTQGLPFVPPEALTKFATDLDSYANAVRAVP